MVIMKHDTIVTHKGGSGAILVLIERKSRYVHIWKLPNLKPTGVQRRLHQIQGQLKINSITFDNGIENIYHQDIGVPTYFCDPYGPVAKLHFSYKNHEPEQPHLE